MRLHRKHGVAPIMTCCQVCNDSVGMILAGASADKISNEAFGEPYRATTARSIAYEICNQCQKVLDDGGVVFLCEDGRAIMMAKQWVDRCWATAFNVPYRSMFRIHTEDWKQFFEKLGIPIDQEIDERQL